jgi:hypothetical protein
MNTEYKTLYDSNKEAFLPAPYNTFISGALNRINLRRITQ